jgi:alpha-1,3-rhamnosyltransferase
MENITKNDTLEQPLVSIIVITYNSSKYVLETLESAKAQTYQNIELIVSDDCSTDNTVEICREWIEKNKERFVRTELITAEKNTGIPANCNRGVRAAQGEWVKFIAGDDILDKKCIENNIVYILKNTSAEIIFSQVLLFKDEIKNSKNSIIYPLEDETNFFSYDACDQYKKLLTRNFVWSAPSSFIKTDTIKRLRLFNEKYKSIEDYPFWLKATKSNIKLYFFPLVTAYYRQMPSITKNYNKWINPEYFISFRQFYEDEIKKHLKEINYKKHIEWNIYFYKYSVLLYVFGNKKNFFSKSFNKLFTLTSPCLIKILNVPQKFKNPVIF